MAARLCDLESQRLELEMRSRQLKHAVKSFEGYTRRAEAEDAMMYELAADPEKLFDAMYDRLPKEEQAIFWPSGRQYDRTAMQIISECMRCDVCSPSFETIGERPFFITCKCAMLAKAFRIYSDPSYESPSHHNSPLLKSMAAERMRELKQVTAELKTVDAAIRETKEKMEAAPRGREKAQEEKQRARQQHESGREKAHEKNKARAAQAAKNRAKWEKRTGRTL